MSEAAVTSEKVEPARLWRLEPPVLKDGPGSPIVRGGFWPTQRKWWELPNFVKLFVGGYGSGKTMVGCKRAISLALINGGGTPEQAVPVAICSPTFTMARETTIVTTNELLEGKKRLYGSAAFDWKYNKTEHVWYFRHLGRYARLIQLTGEDPERLKGPNLGGVLMDEPFIQAKQVFVELHARVRHPRARRLEICGTGTPEQLNWGYDLVQGGDDEFRGIDLGVVFASSRENQALPPDYVKRLEGVLSERAAKAYIEGRFVSLSKGLVYYAFDHAEHVVPLPIPDGAELGCGLDFNVNPMAAVVFWRAGPHVHVFEEIELPNADTEYLCQELHARGHFARGLRNVYPDASGNARHTSAPGGKSDFHYIREAGFVVNAPQANPPRRDRYNAVNGRFKPKDGKVHLTISPSCRKLIKYLSQYSHETMNKQAGMSHLLDAFGYPVSHLFPVNSDIARELRLKGY